MVIARGLPHSPVPPESGQKKVDQRPEVHLSTQGFGYYFTGRFCNLPRGNSFILARGFCVVRPHGFVALFVHEDFVVILPRDT